MKTIILLASLFLSVNVFAQDVSIPEKTVTVHVVHVLGEHAISTTRARELFSIVKGEYSRQLAINLKLKYFRVRNDRISQNLNNRISILNYYERVFSRRPRHRWAHVSMAILPPIKDGGIYYLAGYANGTCRFGKRFGVAVANAEETNSYGALRFVHSIVAFMHELGHLLGAKHNDALPATVMHSAAMAYVDSQGGAVLDFHPNSVKQILSCIRRLR